MPHCCFYRARDGRRAASPSRAQQNTNPLPAGDGRDLVSAVCSQCHYLGTIAKIRDGAPGWRLFVSNMVLRGAQLTDPEIDTVVNYLALNLGPGINLPPEKPVVLPDGQGKNLVETRCNLCHDLERIATVPTAQSGLADHCRQHGRARRNRLARGSAGHRRLSGREFWQLSYAPRGVADGVKTLSTFRDAHKRRS